MSRRFDREPAAHRVGELRGGPGCGMRNGGSAVFVRGHLLSLLSWSGETEWSADPTIPAGLRWQESDRLSTDRGGLDTATAWVRRPGPRPVHLGIPPELEAGRDVSRGPRSRRRGTICAGWRQQSDGPSHSRWCPDPRRNHRRAGSPICQRGRGHAGKLRRGSRNQEQGDEQKGGAEGHGVIVPFQRRPSESRP